MAKPDFALTRRDMLKLSAGGAGAVALTASGLAVPRGFGASSNSNKLYIEAFPTSPLILNPFSEFLKVPTALRPADMSSWGKSSSTSLGGLPDREQQDSCPRPTGYSSNYTKLYGQQVGRHQIWPGEGVTAGYYDNTTPIVYQLRLLVGEHSFTNSQVQPIDSFGKNVAPPGKDNKPRSLPNSTIWGFNGTFPGPRINAEYGRASLVRFENWLGNDNGYDNSQASDFGAPNRAFLTHLHNGHTAPESDGQPHYTSHRFAPMSRYTHEAAFEPGEWIDQMYLGYPAGGDDREKQSFFWFHDHVHGFTGANVYKGMVGLMPIYDPKMDNGDETKGYRLPGVRTDYGDGTFDVDYDIPLALYDCRLDDGVTPHKDVHDKPADAGKAHPEWWGKTFFKHFPNHGFVGDIFTVNGAAYPVLKVKRRKYRLRFLDASISRIYNLQLMHSTGGPKAARDLGYIGDELQGQYRLPDGEQCMKFVQVANEGGLLPQAILRDDFELWPAKRREVVVDFTQYKDGTPTKKDEEIYLVNTMKMTTGRLWDLADPAYKVPLLKFVIDDDKAEPDNSLPYVNDLNDPAQVANIKLRPIPDPVVDPKTFPAVIKDQSLPTFELQRGSVADDPEVEWLINGQEFDPNKPLISVKKNSGAVWRIRNGGGGWVHPMHLHMEEHLVLARNKAGGYLKPDARHPDDTAKEDVIALDPSEEVVISRRFRTFTGPYVAHCHNLAHEDHNMMFGWDIRDNPPKS
jgi:FtsP/CotA-like multicopper oxidase with cupredoxin domain